MNKNMIYILELEDLKDDGKKSDKLKTNRSDGGDDNHTGLDEIDFTNHRTSTDSEQKNVSTKKSYSSKSRVFTHKTTKKTMGPVCTCKLKCYENINQEARMTIYNEYHGQDMTWRSQKQYIISRVTQKPVLRHYTRRTRGHHPVREVTFNYTFLVNEKPVKVCKPFFLNTLALSSSSVRRAVINAKNGVPQEDRRGKRPPGNKIPEKVKEKVKDTVRTHIDIMNAQNLLQHVARDLNIRKMYTLYQNFCEKESIPTINVAKFWLYRSILKTEYDSLFQPLVDGTGDENP